MCSGVLLLVIFLIMGSIVISVLKCLFSCIETAVTTVIGAFLILIIIGILFSSGGQSSCSSYSSVSTTEVTANYTPDSSEALQKSNPVVTDEKVIEKTPDFTSEEKENSMDAESAEKLVQRYYELLSQKSYYEAHNMQSARFSQRMTVERMHEIWSNNNTITSKDMSVYLYSRFEAQVSLRLLADDTDRNTGKSSTTPWLMKVKLVMEHGEWKYDEVTYERDTTIHSAAYNGDISSLHKMLEDEPEIINAQNDKGDTPLLLSAYGGHKEAVEYLISRGADINAQNNHGDTALHLASWKGYKPVVEQLLTDNADTMTQNKDGYSASEVANSEDIKEVLSFVTVSD